MGIAVTTNVVEYINFAAVSCGVKITAPIVVTNGSGKEVILRITSLPQFVFEYKKNVILENDRVEIEAPDLILDIHFWRRNYVEAGKGEIKVEILDVENTDKILAFQHYPVHIQPYLHWDVMKYAYTMPAFMQPHDNLVAEVLKTAGKYANEYGVRMYGYSEGSRESVTLLTKAVYQALIDQGIHYISYPPSYEFAGQKIRIPRDLLNEELKQGTCLDLAVLFATCLETVGLNPVIIVIPGHAFAGVWLEDSISFPNGLYKDGNAVKSMKSKFGGALLPVECTTFADGGNVSFEQAVEIANRNIDDCRYVLDVVVSRQEGVVPVYSFIDEPICSDEDSEKKEHNSENKDESKDTDKSMDGGESEGVDESKDGDEAEGTSESEDSLVPKKEKTSADTSNQKQIRPEHRYGKKFYEISAENETKLQRLQKQAMDISVRNHLIAKKADVPKLEFMIPMADFLRYDYGEEEFFVYAKERILEAGTENDAFEQTLRRLWISDRQIFTEQGKHILYLAMNELVWKKENENIRYHAALYLCPVEIIKNKRGEYWFKVKKEEMFFNPVLKELLMQDYDINIYDMKDIPMDNEYQEQMDMLRYSVEKKQDWKVIEDKACISSYAIPNEAIWRALKNPEILKNEIISSILDGAMHWNNKVETNEQIANEYDVYVFPSDSSQSEVIRLASQRKTQVVIGPAGNGKTQTISNILADEMRRGKNVLFVSEKISALEVLLSMIKKANMERFCLYLPDGVKAAKSMKEQIDNTMRFMEQYESMERTKEDFERGYLMAAKKINDFHESMKKRDTCGKSLQELIEIYEQYRDIPSLLSWKQAKKAMNHEDAEDLIDEYIHTLSVCGKVNVKFQKYFRKDELSTEEERDTRIYVDTALRKMDKLKQCIHNLIVEMDISIDNLDKKQEIVKFVGLASYIRNCPVIGEDLNSILKRIEMKSQEIQREVLELLDHVAQANPKSHKYKIESRILDDKIDAHYSDRFCMKWFNMENTETKKAAVLNAGIEDLNLCENEEVLTKLNQYFEIKRNMSGIMSGLTKEQKDAFEHVIYCVVSGTGDHYCELADHISIVKREFWDVQDKAAALVLCNLQDFEKNYPRAMKVDLLKEWKDNEKHMKDLKIFQSIFKQAEEIGLQSILKQIDELVDADKLSAEQIKDTFAKCWCEYNIEKIMNQNESIITDHVKYRQALKKYCGQEEKIRKQLRESLVDIQMQRLPNMEEGMLDNPEWGKLNKSIRRKGKIMGAHKVFEQSPNILAQMYPCMLMTPGAVAEYIPDNFPEFDMVIIDEGSQMPTYKALIPISKGKRCLIFGDEMQLTPTKFFQKRIEEEGGYMAPIESILEDAIITGMPKKMLKYHYRSENENLMAFSNHTYYNGEVVTFPSCSTKVTGIDYRYLKNGCYDRGATKTNSVEADYVVNLIQSIFENLPENTSETVGVITLNIAQRNLIQSKLLSCNREKEDFGRKVDELVQVVNLEMCQGKEWDHVILSLGYGVDKDGKFLNNFGPLGLEDGGNRLNVMITRSKKHMYVVTSMQPEMIGSEVTGGVKDLKNFLIFARGDHRYDKRTVGAAYDKNSIYKAITKELTTYGYEVHTDIGSSKCKIDIAVVSKKNPNVYQLGIILDNFNEVRYNIKDKEIICPTFLQGKGWKIHRLHSINWYRDYEYELKTILGLLD